MADDGFGNCRGDVTVTLARREYTILRDPILKDATREKGELFSRHFRTCPNATYWSERAKQQREERNKTNGKQRVETGAA